MGVDFTRFTDRSAKNPVAVSELDFTAELVLHLKDFDAHVAYERDLPVDRSGLVQQLVYLLVTWSFDLKSDHPVSPTHKNPLPSP